MANTFKKMFTEVKGNGVKGKEFNTQQGIGSSKYVVNYHDGEKTHKDGSKFFDIKILKNAKEFKSFQKSLKLLGYEEK